MRPSSLKLANALAITTVLLLGTVAYGQAVGTPGRTASGQPEIYFVPDVVGQFNQLALRPDPLAFGLGKAPDPSIGKHFQGIVRRHGPGRPYLYLSRSGNQVDECKYGYCDEDDDPGNIYIVWMGSKGFSGERLRTNRFIRGWSNQSSHIPFELADRTVATIYFDGQNGWPNYGHPGGMQMVGDVLVVPLSHAYNSGDPANLIVFLDVSSPEAPVLKSQFDPLQVSPPSAEFEAGQVAVTPVLNPDGPGVRYIMLIAGKDNKEVRLYRSLSTTLKEENGRMVLDVNGPTDLKASNLNWEFVRSWTGDEMDDPGKDTWRCCGSQSYQMFNFVRQGSLEGPLFLIGAYNDEPVLDIGGGHDFLDLFEVHVDGHGNPEDHLLTQVERKHVSTDSIGGYGDTSHFAGATGVYVSPSGELIIYGSQHNNEGPYQDLPGGEVSRRTVRFGEWRHREMVRPGSPTLKPSVEPQGPFEVDEGSTVTLAAQGRHAITKAWLQLFEDDGMGLTDHFDGNNWLAVDYEEWDKDNFDNYPFLWPSFNDNAGSWRWFAPVGCTLRVNEHSMNDQDFPGRRKTLAGTGLVEEASDLDAVRDDENKGSMDDMISSNQFFCDDYYYAPISVSWDLDRDDTFETTGTNVTFSAAELDGPETPALYSLPVRAQHPTDTTPLGQSAPATYDVRVRNVAPAVAGLSLVDSLGRQVGNDVPFALVNLAYAAEASFTDPGKPDHQSARLDMGDGTVYQSTEFDSFKDAFGGAIGELSKRHRYRAAGTYTTLLEVKDDDGGVTAATRTVTVVSPAQVVGRVVEEIDRLLATTTNQKAIRALRDARDNLVGSNNGSASNGALDALESGDLVAALEKIKAALEALGRAEAAGAGDLRDLKYLLGFTAESVAEGAYQEAETAVGTPSPGQAAQLERIRQSIVEGHALLVSGVYLPAIDLFKDAAGRALSLL